jgi:hypothetical protein
MGGPCDGKRRLFVLDWGDVVLNLELTFSLSIFYHKNVFYHKNNDSFLENVHYY